MDGMQQESKVLVFLYNTFIGRVILKLISCRLISFLCGVFLNSSLSKCLIKSFVLKNDINLDDYYSDNFKSFNEFFSRKIKEDRRPIDKRKGNLIAPCDGRLLVYNIRKGLVIPVKQTSFTISSLLKDDELASSYENGFCLVFRLGVDNYHRYCYLDDGTKLSNKFIKGRLHTVRPIALSKFPVFCENAREYTVLQTKNFSDVIQVEVGALLVGKIKNFHNEYTFRRGEEKGCFLYGGSTIILLFKEGTIELRDELFTSSNDGDETPVKMGEVIGRTRER